MKFIAHRGYCARYPENTLPAFGAVISHPQVGVSLIGIELDIHLSADGRIPVMHDTVIRGRAVSALTLTKVRDLYRLKHPDTAVTIPELHDVLNLVAHKTELNLELKTGDYRQALFLDRLMDELEPYSPRGDVVLSSFSPELLRAAMRRCARLEVRYGYLFEYWKDWRLLPADLFERIHYLNPYYKLLLRFPDRITALGRPVHCWAVNDPAVIRAIACLPHADCIRAVMTDDLALAETCAEL